MASVLDRGSVVATGSRLVLLNLGSRICGIATMMLVAALFGTRVEYESFIIASSLPQLFNNALLFNSIPRVFVPIFTEYAVRYGEEEAWRFASVLATAVILVALAGMAVAIAAVPLIVDLSAPGMDPTARRLTVELSHWLFLSLGFSALGMLITGVLNAHSIFAPPAAWSLLASAFNLVLIVLMGDRLSIWVLVLSNLLILCSPIIGLLITYRQLLLSRFRPSLNILQFGLGKSAGLLAGIAVIALLNQINVMSDRFFASLLGPGSIATLEYASRQVPIIISIFVQAIVTPILVDLSTAKASDDTEMMVNGIDSGLRLTALLLLPVVAFHIVFRIPIFAFLFQSGAYTQRDTEEVAAVFLALAPALVFWGLGQILNATFFAMQLLRIPILVTLSMVGLNIAADIVLVGPLGLQGLALASGMGAAGGFIILLFALKRHYPLLRLGPLAIGLARTAVAAIAAALIALPVAYIPPPVEVARLDGAIRIAMGAAIAVPAYLFLLRMFRVNEVDLMLAGLQRRLTHFNARFKAR